MSEDRLDAIERLARMRDAGTLTAEEFEAEKARLLRGQGTGKPWALYAGIAAGALLLALGGGWAIRQMVGPVQDQTRAEPSAAPSASDAASALVPTPSASPSEDPYAGAKPVDCRQGQCTWEKVLNTATVSKTATGTLMRQDAWVGTSGDEGGDDPAKAKITWEKAKVQTFVFCSTAQPAIAFSDHWEGGDGHWTGHWIDLFDVSGYMTASARTYMQVCHDVDFFRPDITRVLQRMGYRPGTPSEQRDLARPQEITQPPKPENAGEAGDPG